MGNVKYKFWLLIKTCFVLLTCLCFTIWFHRKKIVKQVIVRQLHEIGVDDLRFEVGEFSFECFELHDIVWGRENDACLYLANARVKFSVQGLLDRRIDRIELNLLETWLDLKEQGQMENKLLDRSLEVWKRFNEIHPLVEKGGQEDALQLPQMVLKRSSVVVRGHDGFERGRVDFSADFGSDSGCFSLKGVYALPGGRSAAFHSDTDWTFSQKSSSMSAGIEGVFDLTHLIDPDVDCSPETVGFTGEVSLKLVEGEPEWVFRLILSPQQYSVCFANCRVSAFLSGVFDFEGTRSDIFGEGEAGFSNVAATVHSDAGDMLASNYVAYASVDVSLPSNSLAEFHAAVADCKLSLTNVCVSSDIFDLNDGRLYLPFTAGMDSEVSFGDSILTWTRCSANGVEFKPQDFYVSTFSNVLRVKSGVYIEAKPVEINVDCNIPFKDPFSGKLFVEVPEVELTSDGALADLLEDKSGQSLEYNGLFSAFATMESLNLGSPITGRITLKNGEVSAEKLHLSGLNIDLPFRYDEVIRSTGTPRLFVESIEAGNIRLSSGEVLFHLRQQELFIEKGEIGWAKGFLRAYAVHVAFDGNILNEFIVYADKVDMGEVFMLVTPLEGRMEGFLYGRFAIGLKNRKVNLSTGYLYSLPGQGGYLKFDDSESMETLLRRAGVRRDVDDIAKALSDLDLSTIRMDLVPGHNKNSSLKIRLVGKSNYEKRPAPVDLNLNLNGPLDEVLNLGVDMHRLIKR